MKEEKKVKEKYSAVKSRLSKCINELEKAQNKEKYNANGIHYGWFLTDAALSCMNPPPEKPISFMFEREGHELSPLNCYFILEGKKNPQRVKSALYTLDLLVMNAGEIIADYVDVGKIKDVADLFKQASTYLDNPNRLY